MARNLQDCVVLFGDSLTQGQEQPGNLQERMNKAYERKLSVLNMGFGGYNSNGLRALLPQVLAKKGEDAGCPIIRLMTIWIGSNDAGLDPYPQGIPLETFIENLHHILSDLTAPDSPYAVADTPLSILLITPGPSLPSMYAPGSGKEEWCRPESVRRFVKAVLEVGAEWKIKEKDQKSRGEGRGWKIATLDLWGDMVRAAGGEGEELRPYFTTKAYQVLWDGIANAVQTEFKGRGLGWEDDSDLPRRVPDAINVDWQRPESIVEGMKLPAFRLKK